MALYAYLSITSGDLLGVNFPLDPTRETLMGRGADCQVALPDPLCSRVHARVAQLDGAWVIRDAESRNGTFVNGQKVDEATLDDGHTVRIGSTELAFRESDQPLTAEEDGAGLTQTIVQDVPIAEGGPAVGAFSGVPTGKQVEEMVLLHQLCLKLLGVNDPEQTLRVALDLTRKRTGASIVGFLSVDDQGQLRPKTVIPAEAADRATLSPALTELVLARGHAVWVANQSAETEGAKPEKFADAVCAPLIHRPEAAGGERGERRTLGALHVYLEAGRFRQSDFDFIIAVANMLGVALARALSLATLRVDFERLVKASPGFQDLIGESPAMLALKTKVARVARAAGAVLVRGESGTGKELVARAIHRASPRADRPMVSVNCAAIPADLMESQLFGHKAGSFTGADRDHIGYFQQADMGTLFLDEVGELTLEGQAKLLRILEGHPFLPVGATSEVRVDVRVVAATNQDLQTYVREKRFREDLYYRLSVFELQLPPLRERGEDVGRLVDFFLDHFRREHGRPGLGLSDAARQRLETHHWPGNVRQLRNVIDSAVVLAEGDAITSQDLALRDPAGAETLETLDIAQWERRLITQALKQTGGAVPEAAKLLGIGRATLYRKIEQYRIER